MQEMLLSKLNFKAMLEHEKYLGLPTFVGRSKKIVFQGILDRVWKKIKGWKERCLSRAGREVLLKSVAQAIPTYAMQCFKIPEGLINNMNSICRNFWWGQRGSEHKLALISWNRMCRSKDAGGIGLRDLSAFNDALLAKQCWRLVTNPDSFAATVLKGKYFPRTTFWDAKVPPNASYTWRSILSARDLLWQGSKWVIGDERLVRFWKDKWITGIPGGKLYSQPRSNEQEVSTVQDWRTVDGIGWKESELVAALTTEDVCGVKRVYVVNANQLNFLAWEYTKNGEFTVKSSYHLEMQRRHGDIGCSRPDPKASL